MTTQAEHEVTRWDNFQDYIAQNPEVAEFYEPLVLGHSLRVGHELEMAVIKMSTGRVVLRRECCKQ